MKKSTVIVNDKVSKELNVGYLRGAIVFLVCGLFLVGMFIGFGLAFNDFGSVANIVSAVTAIISLALFIVTFKSYRQTVNNARFDVKTVNIELLDEYMTAEVFRKEEKIQESKYYYCDVFGYRVTDNYVFVLIKTNSFLPLNKTEEIINFLKEKGLKETKSYVAKNKKK